jgi:Peptidase M15
MQLSAAWSLRSRVALCAVTVAAAVAGCGSGSAASGAAGSDAGALAALPTAHPQAVEPAAGAQASASAAGDTIVGDVNAHAPSLAEVKQELRQLNLCGGALSRADAAPVVTASGPGFVADPGTIQNVGQLPVLTARLDQLAQSLGVVIYGISGYRTPAHSVAVGGFADDPHTKGEAEDIGVNSLLRSGAAQISEAQLAQYGLYRPFDPSDSPDNTEVNHVQLIPAGGPLTLSQSQSTFDPDPSCK